jgi:hypothetical protein
VDSNLSLNSQNSAGNLLSTTGSDREGKVDYNGLDFRLIVDTKSGPPINITLVASTLHEKAAWCSDISQVGYRERGFSNKKWLVGGRVRDGIEFSGLYQYHL